MRRSLMAAVVLVASCTSSTPLPGPMFVSEGAHHVTTITIVAVAATEEAAQYSALVRPGADAMRDAPGNISVSILRRPAGNDVELTIIAEWTSADRVRRCHGDPKCARLLETSSTRDFDVLFEAIEVEPLPEGTVQPVAPGGAGAPVIERKKGGSYDHKGSGGESDATTDRAAASPDSGPR
jgi:quinol monooxygenase YgiN